MYSVDQQTEEMVRQAVATHFKEHTIISIAHRLDTIHDFDKVIVLDKGSVVEAGKPQDLLRDGGKFKELWDAIGNQD